MNQFTLIEVAEEKHDSCEGCIFHTDNGNNSLPISLRGKYSLTHRNFVCMLHNHNGKKKRKRSGNHLAPSRRFCGNRPVVIKLAHVLTLLPVEPEEIIRRELLGCSL